MKMTDQQRAGLKALEWPENIRLFEDRFPDVPVRTIECARVESLAREAIPALLADLEEAEDACNAALRLANSIGSAANSDDELISKLRSDLDAARKQLAEAQALIYRFGPLLINAGYVGANRDIQRELQSVREGIVSADTSALSAAIEAAVEPYLKDAERYREIFASRQAYAVCVWSSEGKWQPCVSKQAADYTIDAAIFTKEKK